jgi:tetratricopeptide (TPR) repeat protein
VKDPFARLEEARALLDRGRPDAAARLLDAAFPEALVGEKALLRGDAFRDQGFFRLAQDCYRRSLRAAGPQERDIRLCAELGLARCARSLGEVRDAAAAMKRARKAARGEAADTLALEDALVKRAAGDYAGALKGLLPLLAASRRRKDWSAVGYLLWATGGARRFAGDLAGSHRDFKESLAAFKRGGDREGQSYALFGLGGIARVRGLFAEARAAYAAAGRLLAGGPDLFGRAYAHCGLANVLRQLGRLDEAERNYHKSYALYAKLDDRVDLAYVDWGLGQVFQKRGDARHAEKHYRAALKAFHDGGEHRGEALSLKSLAEVLHVLGRSAEAEKLFDQAVSVARRAGLKAHLETYT